MTTRKRSNPEEEAERFKQMQENAAIKRKQRNRSIIAFQVAPGDVELLDLICEKLSVRRSEAARTAIRVYAALLQKSRL